MPAIALGILLVISMIALGVLTQIEIYFGTSMDFYQNGVAVAMFLGVLGVVTKIILHFMDIAQLKMKVKLEELIMIRNNPSIPMEERVREAAAAYCKIYFPAEKNTPEHIDEMAKVFQAGVIWLANPGTDPQPQ